MKSNGKVIFALLAGAAAGAALGLLLAPKKGSESRKAIADAAGNLINSLGIREKFEDITGTGSSHNGNSSVSGSNRTEASSSSQSSPTAEAGRSRTGQTA